MDKSSPLYIRGNGNGRPEVRLILEKLMNLGISLGSSRSTKIPGIPMAVDLLSYEITGVYTEPSQPGFSFTYSNEEDLIKLRSSIKSRGSHLIDEGGDNFIEKFGKRYDILFMFIPLNSTDECYVSLGEIGDITEQESNYFVGPGDQLERLWEVISVKQELINKGIDLTGFNVKVQGVLKRPRPFGFDFYCKNAAGLLSLVANNSLFARDDIHKPMGKFVASQSNGASFRQIGFGKSLHVIINTTTGKCNAHLDSHGFVEGQDDYNCVKMLSHGYWDLLGDKASPLFRTIGANGAMGPWFHISYGRYSSDPVFRQIFPALSDHDKSEGGLAFMIGVAGTFD